MNTNYKSLFEGKFTQRVGKIPASSIHKIYYYCSLTTYTERTLKKFINLSLEKFKEKTSDTDIPKVIDMGCGGGNESLAKIGSVSGIDISELSIKNAVEIYKEAKALDITKGLPYEDESFDIGFSSEVLGHISNKDKEIFLSEMNRVLKKRSYVVISSETDGSNWYTKFLKSKNLYKQCWIDPWGHIGLVSMQDTTALISNFFDIKKITVTSTWCLSLDNLEPILRKNNTSKYIVNNNSLRRIFNLLLYPLYKMSIIFYSHKSVNDVIYLAQKKDTVNQS